MFDWSVKTRAGVVELLRSHQPHLQKHGDWGEAAFYLTFTLDFVHFLQQILYTHGHFWNFLCVLTSHKLFRKQACTNFGEKLDFFLVFARGLGHVLITTKLEKRLS